MNTRNTAQWIAVILIIAAGACGSTVFANSVHIYIADFDLPIPTDPDGSRGWMTDAVIEIPDHFTIDDLDVGISLTHTNVFDLQIFLQNPSGTTRICLNMYDFKNDFSVRPNYTNTIFDDEAEVPIEGADSPFTGRFRPFEPFQLSEFDGEQTAGLWRLQILDRFYADTGTLNHFELVITTPEPTTSIFLLLGTGLLCLHKHRSPISSKQNGYR